MYSKEERKPPKNPEELHDPFPPIIQGAPGTGLINTQIHLSPIPQTPPVD